MKLHKVKSAQKEYRCDKCLDLIGVGESYTWWQPYKSRIQRWHAKHGPPPQSQLTSSDKKAKAYEAREILKEFFLKALDKVQEKDIDKETIHDFLTFGKVYITQSLEMAEYVMEEYITSAENIEKRFGETPISVYCRETAGKIDTWLKYVKTMDAQWDTWVLLQTSHETDAVVAHKAREMIGHCLHEIWELEL